MRFKRYWKNFYRQRGARAALWIIFILLLGSLTSELWINNRPLVLYYEGRFSFPVLSKVANPEGVGKNLLGNSYRTLKLASNDWALWPLIPWTPYERNPHLDQYPGPPSEENIFGTDDRGRDLLARLVYGFRHTFFYAFGVWLLSTFLGLFWGGFLLLLNDWVDDVIVNVVRAWESLPGFLIVIFFLTLFAPSILLLIVISSLFSGVQVFYYVRQEIQLIRHREFIMVAQMMGAKPGSIFIRHILPHCLVAVVTFAPLMIMANITFVTKLDYFGFGFPPPQPNWGELLYQGQKYLGAAAWLFWIPTGAMILTLVLLTVIGQGLRQALQINSGPSDW